jgi:hypothetical protein
VFCSKNIVLIFYSKLAQAIKVDTASIPAMGSSVAEIKQGVEGLQLREDSKA